MYFIPLLADVNCLIMDLFNFGTFSPLGNSQYTQNTLKAEEWQRLCAFSDVYKQLFLKKKKPRVFDAGIV